jgi:hypothetical protein
MATVNRPSLAALFVALVTVVGCTTTDGGTQTRTSTPTPTPSASASPVTHPTGADEAVVQVFSGGGLIPEIVAVSEIPEWTLYGDGTIVYGGPQTQEGTAPAVPNLLQRSVPTSSIDTLIAEAGTRGMLVTQRLAATDATDLWTTTVSINADDRSFQSSVYGLGFRPTEGAPSPTNDQSADIAEVQAFIDFAEDPENWSPSPSEPQPYAAETWQVYAFPAADTPSSTETTATWPLEPPIPVLPEGRTWCTTVRGKDLATLEPLASAANTSTPWRSRTSGDHRFTLVFVPVLPGEAADCSAV